MQAWEADKDRVCARIGKNPGTLKILLKTKDDPFFLERWIKHHAKIVGLNNIIIFDNMSTDQAVLRIYKKYSSEIEIVRFEGFHNDLHNTGYYPELYAALSRSCEYFIFLDTDESLILIDNSVYHQATSLLRFIDRNHDIDIFPAAWLLNMAGSDTKFWVGKNMDRLADGLKWGKPIIRSNAAIMGFINHNIQLERTLFRPRILTNFFVLHMVQLSPKQRIMANFYKLVARKFISPGESIERVADIDISRVTDQNIRLYVSEIGRLLPKLGIPNLRDPELAQGCLELCQDGLVSFYSNAERDVMANYLTNSSEAAMQILGITG